MGSTFLIRSNCQAGSRLVTLRDAAEFIMALPEADHGLPHWVTAIEWLMLVGEHGGNTQRHSWVTRGVSQNLRLE
jgi:hypothetical protein